MNWFSKLQEAAKEGLKTLQDDVAEFGKAIKDDTETLVSAAPTTGEIRAKTEAAIPELAAKSQEIAHEVNEHLDQVGSSLETFGKSVFTGTTEIFSQVKEAIQMEVETKQKKKTRAKARNLRESATVGPNGKYSRFEAQVSAMQRDSSTYCDEPTDVEDYKHFKLTFKLDSQKATIEELLKDNAFMKELESRIVPLIVDHETFWTRYFYRLSKLQRENEQREKLVKLANKPDEDLSWDTEEGQEEAAESGQVDDAGPPVTSAPVAEAEAPVAEDKAKEEVFEEAAERLADSGVSTGTANSEEATGSDMLRVEVADADTSSDTSGVASGEGEESWSLVRSPPGMPAEPAPEPEAPAPKSAEASPPQPPPAGSSKNTPDKQDTPGSKKEEGAAATTASPSAAAASPAAAAQPSAATDEKAKIAALLAKTTVEDDDDIDEDWGDSWDD